MILREAIRQVRGFRYMIEQLDIERRLVPQIPTMGILRSDISL